MRYCSTRSRRSARHAPARIYALYLPASARHRRWNAYAHSNANCNRNSDCNGHANRDTNPNAYAVHGEMFTDAEAEPSTSAAPLTCAA